jgi:parallel beta-helix repeat protein
MPRSLYRLLAGSVALLAAASVAFAATTYYVAPGGSGPPDGSQAHPFAEIRDALAVAAAGDTILVADGSYKGFTLDGFHATAAARLTITAQGIGAQVVVTTDRSDNRDTIFLNDCSYVTLEGLRSYNANRAAVRISESQFITVRNGVFGDNATWGIFTGFSDDLLIENNECYGSVEQHGIYVSNSAKRPVVRGNRIHHNAGCGLHMNGDLSMGGDGIISGALVEKNVIWENGAATGGSAINMDGVQDSVIRDNLLINNHASGICAYQIDGAAGPKGDVIANNTIVMASNGRYAVQLSETTGVNTVRNNVLYNLNPNRGGLAIGSEAADTANVDSDYNIFPFEAPYVATDDWDNRYTLAQWQGRGLELHSFVGKRAELFVNPTTDVATADYHLLTGSAAIDSGDDDTVTPGEADLDGRPRIAGAHVDIGAYEWAPAGSKFYPVTPCRVVDTRSSIDPAVVKRGNFLEDEVRAYTLSTSAECPGLPSDVTAWSLNIQFRPMTVAAYLIAFPDGITQPAVSTLPASPDRWRVNNAIVPAGSSGTIDVYCQYAGRVIIDVNGYFAP